MKIVVVKLREPIQELVMTLNGKGIELKKKPSDPSIKAEFGESLVLVRPDVEGRKLLVQHNIGAVVDTRTFSPEERDGEGQWTPEVRMRTSREELLEASLNANCGEIDKLAEFICREFPDELGKFGSESAVECAIRILEQKKGA